MKKLFTFFLFISLCVTAIGQTKIDLSGEWRFALDPTDIGISEQWFKRNLTDKIHLPGSLQEQAYGEDVSLKTKWTGQVVDSAWFKSDAYAKYREPGNVKIPFWLQPEKHYVGVAWYQKIVEIPDSWQGKYVELELERTHWETTLYVNGKECGTNNSLQTPHRYTIDETGKVTLTVRVDNRVNIPVGINAHSVSDHTQSNWNGIVGNLSLFAKPSLYIDDVQVYPNVQSKKAKVVVSLKGETSGKEIELTLHTKSFNCTLPSELNPVSEKTTPSSRTITVELDMGENMLTWSEFEPNLYRLNVELLSDEGKDVRSVDFGMREFKAEGRRFTVNGIPVFLRGTLECAIFPLTGYASMDPAYWQKIFRQCKEFGLNHVRFHSWCPPKAAFEMADKEGIYLHVECGGWTTIGDGKYIDQWFYQESDRILKEYGNHPSFCMLEYGNEPGGRNQGKYLAELVDYWKNKDSRRVYSGAAGWPYIENADYWNTPDPRIQAWGGGLKSIINAQPPKTDFDFREIIRSKPMPAVSHEIGQWCVYPNLKEMSKYKGVLKAKNFQIFKETLEEHHLGDLADEFLYASGRLQTICYKADIEAALRTPEFAGFQLLDLHDFPGQGTALVGVLDPFWETKGYVDGKEFRSFSNHIVPLARMSKLIWTNDETFTATIEVAHFEKAPLKNATVKWTIRNSEGKTLQNGQSIKDLPIDNCIPISEVKFGLEKINKPEQLVLSVVIDGTNAGNQWNFWVYPKNFAGPKNVPTVTSDYKLAIRLAKSGKNVLYCMPKGDLKPEKGGDIKVGFSSIFWNTAWTSKQPPHELGVYCNPEHPALSLFPNNGYSDYQWWEIVSNCSAIVLDDFPAEYRPVIHLIDDWFTNRKLGILFETKVGKGKLMVCGADLITDIANRPAAMQFRRSIENYMSSGDFNPITEIGLAILDDLLVKAEK